MAAEQLPDQAIVTAFFDQLDGDAAIIWTVYKRRVPKNTDTPYIYIGAIVVTEESNKTSWGNNSVITIHCYSSRPYRTEVNNMMNLTLESLTGSFPLAIAGFHSVNVRLDNSLVLYSTDEASSENEGQEIWHGVLRIRVITTGPNR